MNYRRLQRLGAIGVASLAIGAVVAGDQLITAESSQSLPTEPTQIETKMCEDWGYMSDGECWAAGAIRFVAFNNLQGAAQFCKWRAANPGEWNRLKGYAETETTPVNIVTWFGAAQKNMLEAYFATGAPTFTIQPNTAPNVCKTPFPPPVIGGVTPDQNTVTVTIEE